MKTIAEIDSNFQVNTNITESNIKFLNADSDPFKIYGLLKENGIYRRLPQSVSKTVSPSVDALCVNTAGGRVRFKTDSLYVAINTKMWHIGKMPHFAISGSAGFDMYILEKGIETYYGTYMPPFDIADGYEGILYFPDKKLREITINFPTYSGVKDLFIGLDKDSVLLPPEPYKISTPIVYYGSSITQGGCCSRPGNSYESMISQIINCDYINLGFSGNAKGEDEIAEYIKDLSMSAFVYDYDHNAPSNEHLQKTHERMFKIIRKDNPDLPIIIMPRPKYVLTDGEKIRYNIISRTYINAIESGDKNTYFVSNKELMKFAKSSGTVDNCHPNDLGFASMTKALIQTFNKIFK